jgi:hypothetical protein
MKRWGKRVYFAARWETVKKGDCGEINSAIIP